MNEKNFCDIMSRACDVEFVNQEETHFNSDLKAFTDIRIISHLILPFVLCKNYINVHPSFAICCRCE